MAKFSFEVKYAIGEEIKWDGGIFKVIGYSYIEGRGLQYIVMSSVSGKVDWQYFYEFEIKMMQL